MKRVLVVDDELSPQGELQLRGDLERQFGNSQAYEFVGVMEGEQALAKIRAEGGVDLMVLEAELGGWQLLEDLEADGSPTPTAIVTSNPSTDNLWRAANQRQVAAFLSKPPNYRKLARIIESEEYLVTVSGAVRRIQSSRVLRASTISRLAKSMTRTQQLIALRRMLQWLRVKELESLREELEQRLEAARAEQAEREEQKKRDRERERQGLAPESAFKKASLEFRSSTRHVEGDPRTSNKVYLRWSEKGRLRAHLITAQDLRDPDTYAFIDRLMQAASEQELEIAKAFFENLLARERRRYPDDLPSLPSALQL